MPSIFRAILKNEKGFKNGRTDDTVRREMLSSFDGPDTTAIPLLYYLLEYGRQNYEITILEGILFPQWYTPLFEKVLSLFDRNVFGYYYALPFKETIIRHNTKPVASEFGEEDLRRWWREADLLEAIPERILTREVSLADAAKIICQDISENSENNTADILKGHR